MDIISQICIKDKEWMQLRVKLSQQLIKAVFIMKWEEPREIFSLHFNNIHKLKATLCMMLSRHKVCNKSKTNRKNNIQLLSLHTLNNN